MKTFFKTTKAGFGRGSHAHIIYLNDEVNMQQSARCECAVALGHVHNLMFQAGTDEVRDEQGNVTQEATDAFIFVEPDPNDGHSHEVGEYYSKASGKKESDIDILSESQELFDAAAEWERDSFEKAKESEEFRLGVQWDEADASRLAQLERACLTLNHVGPVVNELVGWQRAQRTAIKYTPKEGGDQVVADLFSEMATHILNECDFDFEESESFEDLVTTGRGCFNCYMDFLRNPEGDFKIEKFPWSDVLFGPHNKKDASDCEHWHKMRLYSRGRAKALFPDKAEEFDRLLGKFETLTSTGVTPDTYDGAAGKTPLQIGSIAMVDVGRKEILVVETWRVVYKVIPVLANVDEDVYYNAEDWDAVDIQAVEGLKGFVKVERPTKRYRITKWTSGFLISDETNPDLPAEEPFLIPMYGIKRGNLWHGVVEDLKDAQREINKRHSQAIDVGNKMASYLWWYDSNTFPDDKEKDKFKKNATQPGAMFQVVDTAHPPRKEEGVSFPTTLVELMNLDKANLKELGGLNIQQLSQGRVGADLVQAQRLTLIGHEWLFDALRWAKRRIGRLLLSVIRKYYSPERVVRIIAQNYKRQNINPELRSFSETEVRKIFETADTARYDVVVTEADWSPSARMQTHVLLSDLAAKGAQIPPEVLIEVSPMPDEFKRRALDGLQAQANAQGQQQAAGYDMEIDKTLIAKGIIPPSVQEKYGIDARGNPMQPQQQQQPLPSSPMPPMAPQNPGA